ncbi:hypothetical protein CBR_g31533 [Chara braunii]|uniref:Uncharacterized protein n=1 Tax=Chara braunii TaxID=69332 RepID=A0A388LFE2_CHABU|nr:hypothetical protein CBR_g31533 [Chara braunii]|eukprot:GBG80977.1 hypothetical protein CBR_g31533 [Chara braunii]
MAEEDRASRGQHSRGRSPPSRSDIPVSDEDRLRLLISKCYDDGILPEKFRHGEWKMEAGVKTFVVNPRLDELTTNWLKERTVTIIFQRAARDLPMKVREDLIRAYENGWYRQRIFDRTTKRGRVHAKGPNVVSYAAKSREVAQWMIAKAEDNVVIRGVEYSMVFKPWLTRTELEERRRLEDDSKFWVMAIRVPLRAMFHVESMIETSMGHVINSLPSEQDKTRPKLMNLKFDLVREAEENFEAELPRLGSEVLQIKFVCKHTPWCTRCRWWYHTAEDGCPRVEEDDVGGSNVQRQGGNFSNRNQGQAEDRHIRTAAREVIPLQEGQGQQERLGAAGPSHTQGASQDARRGTVGQNIARNSRSVAPQNSRGSDGASQDQNRGGYSREMPRTQTPGREQVAQQQMHYLPPPQMPNTGFHPYIPPWGPMGWQGMGYHQHNPALTDHPPQFYNWYGTGQGLNYLLHEVAGRELAVDHGGRERQARCRQDKGISRPRRQEVVHSDEDADSEGIPEAPTSELSGMEASPGRIPEGADAAGRDGRQFEEQILLPLVCTMQDQKAYVLGLLDREDKLILPTAGLTDVPMQSTVREQVKYMFADRFEFRLFPEFYKPKLRVELDGGKVVRYTVVFIDARISLEAWSGLRQVGLDSFPLEALAEPLMDMLAEVVVEPGVPASFLADLNPNMPRSSNLMSRVFCDCLTTEWTTPTQTQGLGDARGTNPPAAGIQSAVPGSSLNG